MQLRYVFTELGQGLRRNVSMHLAVVLTLFVSLTLVGVGVLLKQQADIADEQFGSQVEITVYLCNETDNVAPCNGGVTEEQRAAITQAIEDSPETSGLRTESKQDAFDKTYALAESNGDTRLLEGDDAAVTVEDFNESIWISLNDPEQSDGVVSAIQNLPGVLRISDQRELLEPVFDVLDAAQWAAVGTAVILVVAALLLVGNTIRLAAFARRKEIGIMRLVGASTLYIALPFLLEALVTALLGVLLAGGALAALLRFVVHDRAADTLRFMPWVDAGDFGVALLVIGVLGPLLTVLPTLLLTRKYLKV
ncbi:permease-like cell division protein FtsX [Nocardioides zeae]|uniref:Cell division protein FtsX n=1 Tax=Nocardioides imazamoxiresistens TaxID=3231893 RepID=A0ABU3PQV1_9ACTN|nr:permease-like cell division protein FtsX [Nocardioides zeae]MDT9591566.1 permease-like cell division protein FtsX [Nocardioides zeae]